MAIDISATSNENMTLSDDDQWDDQSNYYWGNGTDDDVTATLDELNHKSEARNEIRFSNAMAFFCQNCGRKLEAWVNLDADSLGHSGYCFGEMSYVILITPCPCSHHDPSESQATSAK